MVDLPDPERGEGGWGLQFEGEAFVRPEGGTVTAREERLRVEDANSFTIVLTGVTSDGDEDPVRACRKIVESAAEQSYSELRRAHVDDHRELFRRVELSLGEPDVEPRPTEERLAAVQDGSPDPHLDRLYSQDGRYLLIASSRPGTLPATLQGLWTEGMHSPWGASYISNVNLEMNYWPAEPCNLAECAEPLYDFLDSLRDPGRLVGDKHYDSEGFVLHANTDRWGIATPQASVGIWPVGGVWLCQQLWEHYAFSGDREFLSDRAYPVMKEAATFVLDYPVEGKTAVS